MYKYTRAIRREAIRREAICKKKKLEEIERMIKVFKVNLDIEPLSPGDFLGLFKEEDFRCLLSFLKEIQKLTLKKDRLESEIKELERVIIK